MCVGCVACSWAIIPSLTSPLDVRRVTVGARHGCNHSAHACVVLLIDYERTVEVPVSWGTHVDEGEVSLLDFTETSMIS